MLDSLNYIKDRFEKCRVADGVYRDEGEVDAENEEDTKKYALFKIIDLIKDTYKDDLKKQEQAKDKLKNITNNCNSIIEKRFGLSDYLFKNKVLTQKYYDLLTDPENFKIGWKTFKYFFEQNDLLKGSYIKEDDDEAIIFKLYSTKGTILYIRLSRRNLKDRQSKESSEENPVNIFKIDMEDKKQLLIYSSINNEYFHIEEKGLSGMQGLEQEGSTVSSRTHNFNKISINDEELANIFKKNYNKQGGIGKKTIKNKSKPLKNTILQKKEILGKDMRIYKINGSKKEYVKYKGNLISISDYKKIIKLKKIKNIVIY